MLVKSVHGERRYFVGEVGMDFRENALKKKGRAFNIAATPPNLRSSILIFAVALAVTFIGHG
jgi:hypothetical protein